jgi:hypothetical protein
VIGGLNESTTPKVVVDECMHKLPQCGLDLIFKVAPMADTGQAHPIGWSKTSH